MGEWIPGDMPCMRGEGPETCGELGHALVLWLGDTMGYGELGSKAPTQHSQECSLNTPSNIYLLSVSTTSYDTFVGFGLSIILSD